MKSIELFAGCGGLALGIAEAGFSHVLVAERDVQATSTLQSNKKRGLRHIREWPLFEGDVRDIDYSKLEADLVAGGPPCQPFSIGGKHKGPSDTRNMWPEAIRAVRELHPKAFVFENVRGLLRPAFENYLEFLKLQLAFADITADGGLPWEMEMAKLKARIRASGAKPRYTVLVQGINAADYGAPQKRHRAIIMGVRTDIAQTFEFPRPTHSREALVWSQRVDGSYWERHGISKRKRPPISDADAFILARIKDGDKPTELPWVTVRDAIADLPKPTVNKEAISGHRLHPGARIYPPRHTGSSWDEPAKALKAGAHGVPGGENILAPGDGTVRYFTVREMARLQGLPDTFRIMGGEWRSPTRQLGNAVPVHVGRMFGQAIKEILARKKLMRRAA